MTVLEDPRWLALSPTRRQALLEEHRTTNVDDVEWWDGVYENFIEECKEQGIVVDESGAGVSRRLRPRPAIYFSGFWSQGDGACFEGQVENWPKFLAAAGKPELVALYQKCVEGLGLSWRHAGSYYHEHCTQFSSELFVNNHYDTETEPLQHDAWELAYKYGSLFEELEDDFVEFVRGRMRDLYHALEEEHDYLTSDETVVGYLLDYCEELLVEEPETEDEAGL